MLCRPMGKGGGVGGTGLLQADDGYEVETPSVRDSHSLVTAWRWVLVAELCHIKLEKSVSCLCMGKESRRIMNSLAVIKLTFHRSEQAIYRSDTE